MPGWLLILIAMGMGIPIVLGVGGDVAKRWIAMKERQLTQAAHLAADKAAAQAAHIEKLEQRVRVLERIAPIVGRMSPPRSTCSAANS